MCGIFFYDVTGLSELSLNAVRTRSGAVSHRGPDGSVCEYVDVDGGRRYMMAFHRLAVIKPGDSGMQPVHLGSRSLICNGEIYNYLDVAEAHGVDAAALGSDVHVLLHVLQRPEAVRAVLDGIDGEFAFVCCDREGGRVIAARDPWGVRPLFLARNAAGVVIAFASEAKALVGAPGVTSVSVFPPGHVMVLPEGGLSRFRTNLPVRLGTDEQTVRRLVETAITKRINHSDRPVGILCSGGLDSAIVTALVATNAAMRDRVRVFTVRYDAGHSDDAFYAALLCSQCHLDLELVRFSARDVLAAIEPVIRTCETCDPNTIRAAIPMYLLARHIATTTDVKVILSGEGADELCCGYSYMRLAPDEEALNSESQRLLTQLHMFDLLRADRCFGAFGLEVRVPYLDLALVDFVASLPGRVKEITAARGYVEKRLLRDAFRDVRTPIGKLLNDARVIDRPKEKLSDGCGFSFVPHLLASLGGEGATRLDQREAAERAHYRVVFDGIYGDANRALVIPRVMPEWAKITGGQDSLLGA